MKKSNLKKQMKIEIVNNFDEFLKLEPVWNSLLSLSDADCFYLTFEWISFWWKRYGEKNEMVILLIKENNEIKTIAPLMRGTIKWRGLNTTSISFIANYYAGRAELIIGDNNEEIFDIIFNYIKHSKYHFDMWYLYFIVKDSLTNKSLKKALNKNKIKFIAMKGGSSPYILIEDGWDSYLSKRAKSLQKNLKKKKNLLVREGGYKIVKYENEIEKAMSELLKISRKTRQYKRNTAIASIPDSIEFHNDLAKMAAKLGWLNIWILKLEDNPIAFEFEIKYKNVLYALKTGFDREYSIFAPGVVLLSHSIRDAFENNFKQYDFLGVNEPYKMKWTILCREHCKYWIFNDTKYGKFLYFWETRIISNLKRIRNMIFGRSM